MANNQSTRNARRPTRGGARGTRASTPPRLRLAPADRRRELLRVAGRLMTEGGVDAVGFGQIAAAAGVTRPLVYKFFPTRTALIIAVLEDFADELAARFGRASASTLPANAVDAARIFIAAVCDTIEDRGTGPWHLFDAKGPDPQVAARAEQIFDGIVAPWRRHIADTAGVDEREAATLARMIVAAGRAVLELWCRGELSREEAVRDAARGVSGLVQGFAASAHGDATSRSRARRRG